MRNTQVLKEQKIGHAIRRLVSKKPEKELSKFIDNMNIKNACENIPTKIIKIHCVKTVRIRSYYGPFELNTERYGVNMDQNNSEYGHFSRSAN